MHSINTSVPCDTSKLRFHSLEFREALASVLEGKLHLPYKFTVNAVGFLGLWKGEPRVLWANPKHEGTTLCWELGPSVYDFVVLEMFVTFQDGTADHIKLDNSHTITITTPFSLTIAF